MVLCVFLTVLVLFLFTDVIHTVGPIGEKKDKLTDCYWNCLKLVKEYDIKTVVRNLNFTQESHDVNHILI